MKIESGVVKIEGKLPDKTMCCGCPCLYMAKILAGKPILFGCGAKYYSVGQYYRKGLKRPKQCRTDNGE